NCSFTLGVPITCGPVAGNCYGKEYYFDYPATNPIARFILASPKIYNITGVCTSSPNCNSQTGQPCTNQYGCWPYAKCDVHYNSGCVIDDGSKGYYSSGTGTVVVVQGAWKDDLYTVDNTSNNNGQNAAEAPYFAELMGSNTTGSGLGFVRYTVSQDRIDVQTS